MGLRSWLVRHSDRTLAYKSKLLLRYSHGRVALAHVHRVHDRAALVWVPLGHQRRVHHRLKTLAGPHLILARILPQPLARHRFKSWSSRTRTPSRSTTRSCSGSQQTMRFRANVDNVAAFLSVYTISTFNRTQLTTSDHCSGFRSSCYASG